MSLCTKALSANNALDFPHKLFLKTACMGRTYEPIARCGEQPNAAEAAPTSVEISCLAKTKIRDWLCCVEHYRSIESIKVQKATHVPTQ